MTRDDLVEHLYRDGRTLEAIGRLYCLSRERIRQILEKRGVPAGIGRDVRSQDNASARWRKSKEDKDARAQKYFGCSYESVLSINEGRNLSDSGSPANLFTQQRRSAALRGIEWRFTLPEWWGMWLSSGKWHLRGRRKDSYCMARILDTGPYAPANVHIITMSENIKEGYVAKPAAKRRQALSAQELTGRQKEIAKLAAQGLKPADIGLALGIKKTTVQVHLCSIKQKLGIYEHMYGKAA